MSDKAVILICLFPLAIAILAAAHFLKSQRKKDILLLFFALCCLGFHLSTMYVSFFKNMLSGAGNYGEAAECQLFPVWYCHGMMVLDLVVAGWWKKKGILFNDLATSAAWGSLFGGFFAMLVMYTEFPDWNWMESSLSHFFLMMSGLYLFVGGYAKVNVFNVIPFAMHFLGVLAVALVIESIYAIVGVRSPNAMFVWRGPVELPEMWGPYFVAPFLGLIFLLGAAWEGIFRKKEDRWYKNQKDVLLYAHLKKSWVDKIRAEGDNAVGLKKIP